MIHPLLLLLLTLLALASASEHTHSATLLAWPLHAPAPAPYATLRYTPRLLAGRLENVAAPAAGLVRVGTDGGAWSVVDAEALARGAITVKLDPRGAVWAVDVSDGAEVVVPPSRVCRSKF